MSQTILTNIGCIASYNSASQEVEYIQDTKILVEDDIIRKVGKISDTNIKKFDCEQKLVTPGFVDSHTHPVFFKGREKEFAMRLNGLSYTEIANKGGGIVSSINGVRNSSKGELIDAVIPRMDRFLQLGTTTIEAKSGYGLDTENELKSLAVLDFINQNHELDVIPTFMGAHAFPPEYENDHDGYVNLLCEEMIPAVAEQGIAKFCDVFCEKGYFSIRQTRKIIDTAVKFGLIPRLHADEFQDSGAAELAVKIDAISADHLMAISENGIKKLSKSNVIATLLPGTTFFLGSNKYAPANKLLAEGVEIALATDFNPGSCHIQSMPFIFTLACIKLGMPIKTVLKATTYSSAKTLQIENKVGSIEVGKRADLIIWEIDNLLQIPYNVTDVPINKVMKNGKFI